MNWEISKKRRKRLFAVLFSIFLMTVIFLPTVLEFRVRYREEKILHYILERNPSKSPLEAVSLQQAIIRETKRIRCPLSDIRCIWIDKYALVIGVIETESEFTRKARSRVGARGYMQLMPATARILSGRRLAPDELIATETNVRMGVVFLNDMLREFENLELALLAYNAGPVAVKNGRGVPSYYRKVMENAARFDRYQPADSTPMREALLYALGPRHNDALDDL